MIRYRLSFPSRIECTTELRRCIAALSRIEEYSEAFSADLELTVQEAFVNAVRHGNGDNPALPVVIQFCAFEKDGAAALEVRVRDCGQGFDPAPAIIRATSPQGLMATCGRGLFLINHFAESTMIGSASGGCELVLRYIPY